MSPPGVGVDVGGTKVLAVLVDDAGAVIAEARRATPIDPASPAPAGAAMADTVAGALDDLAVAAARDLEGLALGVGVPGMLSRDGVLVFAPNLHSASGADLTGILHERIGHRRIVVANDADAAAVAEYRVGAAHGVEDFVMVTLGTGIGGGIVAGGRLLRGHGGFAGEIGHVVVDPSGPMCPCGRRGCWERYASGAGVARLAREAAAAGRLQKLVATCGDAESVRGEDLTHAAAAGDDEALVVVAEVGWWLALGLANLVAVLDPKLFVLGGGLSEASALLLPAARAHLNGLVEGATLREPVDVVAAACGSRAGAIGAALLAMEPL